MSVTMAAWLAWCALSVMAIQAAALVLTIVLRDIPLANAMAAFGLGWGAMTPRLLRKLGRLVRA